MANPNSFNETPVFCDNGTWVASFLQKAFTQAHIPLILHCSSSRIRKMWARLRTAPRIVIYWENQERGGGAIIEEFLDVDPHFDVSERVIVLTSNPIREDVVYFSELGVKRVVRLRNKDTDLATAGDELIKQLKEGYSSIPADVAWTKIQRFVDMLPEQPTVEQLDKIMNSARKLDGAQHPSARYLDIMGSLFAKQSEPKKAESSWLHALDKNPNFFRSYNNLVKFYLKNNLTSEALDLLNRMQNHNRLRISRIVEYGLVFMKRQDDIRAEQYFKRALSRDEYCSGALNGLAEIKFKRGELDESKELLARSNLASQFASKLNKIGVELVHAKEFEKALLHYLKAQYVMPERDKGAQIFFNIGLCYLRWGRALQAAQFLQLAVIKEPNYLKAKQLLEKIQALSEEKRNAMAKSA